MLEIATLAQADSLRARILDTQRRMSQAQQQVASGKRSDVYSGLGFEARTSVSLNSVKLTVESHLQTIGINRSRMESMQHVMSRLKEIAIEVRTAAIQTTTLPATASGSGSSAIKALAQARIKEVQVLLNAELDGRFLFGGLDIDSPPMIDPGGIGQAGTPIDDVNGLAPPLDNTAASGNTRYANIVTYLSTVANYYQGDATAGAQVTARIDNGFDLEYGIRGDDPAFRTVMQALYALATTDLTSGQEGGYRAIVNNALTDFNDGIDEVLQKVGVLGSQQATVEQTKRRHEDFLSTLAIEISDVEDVDAAEAITRMQLLEGTLEASFRVLATLREISLARIL